MKDENTRMKQINKDLLQQLYENIANNTQTNNTQTNNTSLQSSQMKGAGSKIGSVQHTPNAGTANIHSLYQDLFITDMRNDLAETEHEL